MPVRATLDNFILQALASGKYKADASGIIWRLRGATWEKHPTYRKACGHLGCKIYVIGHGSKSVLVHRLVVLSAYGNPAIDFECDHINGIKDDNRPDNLQLVPRRENLRRAYLLGSRKRPIQGGERNNSAVLTEELVRSVLVLRKNSLKSYTVISAETGVARHNVIAICQGRNWPLLHAEVMHG